MMRRSSTVSELPPDPVGDAVAGSIADILEGTVVELVYAPADAPPPPVSDSPTTASASGEGPAGWQITCVVHLDGLLAAVVTPDSTRLLEILDALPGAALRTATQFRAETGAAQKALNPSMRRALRDTLVIEVLAHLQEMRGAPAATELIAETIEYLIELSCARVESREVTHGVVIADVFTDKPRLRFDYPADLRAAKRAPLLFDGQRSLLLIDSQGHPRFELQRHRLDRRPALNFESLPAEFVESGSLVAEATRRVGGVGFLLRADRTIWVFVDGQPLLLRRSARWTAFPLELTAYIASLIGGGKAPGIVVQAAYILSARGHGAILAIVDDAEDSVDDIVSPKDRYDLRNEFDRAAMRPETRLHHLIDVEDLDEQTLARLAGLDGATIVDRDANLLAYGAIVTSSDSQQEGARTAAAKSLSNTADVVLMVSQDGDITVFHEGAAVATLLGRRLER